MNNEEIMKRFNATLAEDNNKKESVTPYRATNNLNTAISNPNINVNSPMNVNIQNGNLNDNKGIQTISSVDLLKPEGQLSSNTSMETNGQVLNNLNSFSNSNQNLNQINQQTQNVNYQPDVTEQYIPNQEMQSDKVYKTTTYVSTQPSIGKMKKRTVKFTLSPETKIAMVIAFILFIFIMIMPTLYDFIRNIRLRG